MRSPVPSPGEEESVELVHPEAHIRRYKFMSGSGPVITVILEHQVKDNGEHRLLAHAPSELFSGEWAPYVGICSVKTPFGEFRGSTEYEGEEEVICAQPLDPTWKEPEPLAQKS